MEIWSEEMKSLAPWDRAEAPRSERSVKSAERTLALFELFSLHQTPLTIGQMSSMLAVPQPSVTMLVRNLVRLGYLEQSPGKRTYLPTVRIMLLGSWVHRRFKIEQDLERHLDALLKQCDETVLLGLQNSIYCQYICTQLPDKPDRLEIQSGMLRPLTRTAIGQVLLSLMPDSEIPLIVRRCNSEFPAHLNVNLSEFLEKIHQVRANGYAESNGGMSPGRNVFAVAIPAPVGQIPMAVGVGGDVNRIAGKRTQILEALKEFQGKITSPSASLAA
jgi:IclR family KDG regulon transcriptional repressor